MIDLNFFDWLIFNAINLVGVFVFVWLIMLVRKKQQ